MPQHLTMLDWDSPQLRDDPNELPPPRAPLMIAAPQLFDGTVMRGPALVAVSGGLIESVTFGDALPPGFQREESRRGICDIRRWIGRASGMELVTGDTNIVNAALVLQYVIRDPAEFLFQIEEAPAYVEAVAEGVLTETVIGMPIDEVLTRGRVAVQ